MARIITPADFSGGNEVAKNSLVTEYGTPIAIKSGVADLAVAGDKIEGISVETKSFSATNQSTVREKLEFARTCDDMLIEFAVTNGTIAETDKGSTYDLSATGTVDGATGGTGDQLILRNVKSSTLGDFVRNK